MAVRVVYNDVNRPDTVYPLGNGWQVHGNEVVVHDQNRVMIAQLSRSEIARLERE